MNPNVIFTLPGDGRDSLDTIYCLLILVLSHWDPTMCLHSALIQRDWTSQGQHSHQATHLEAQSAQITMESSRTITWTIMLVLIALAGSKKVVVSYFGEDFLVDSGCRTKDETVLR